MDIYQRKREARNLAIELIKKALTEDKEIVLNKLVYAVIDTYPVPERPLIEFIQSYISEEKGISLNDGMIKKDD